MKAGRRKEALLANEKTYFTGKPCKHGHIAKRVTINGFCVECSSVKQKKLVANGYSAAYAEKNRDKIRATATRWQQNNKGKVNANTAARHTAKMNRTPNWLTPEEKQRIKCYYQLAAMYSKYGNEKWDVDHIVPLQGKTVSGFHVPWNLRVIPKSQNISKGNRFVG